MVFNASLSSISAIHVSMKKTNLQIINLVGKKVALWLAYGKKFRLPQEKDDITDNIGKISLPTGHQQPLVSNVWPLWEQWHSLNIRHPFMLHP